MIEEQLRLGLLGRSGHRLTLTPAGRVFPARLRVFLEELGILQTLAAQLAMGEESELVFVIGDRCPVPQVPGLLRRFFDGCPGRGSISRARRSRGRGSASSTLRPISSSITSTRRMRGSSASRSAQCTSSPWRRRAFLKCPITDAITPEQMRGLPPMRHPRHRAPFSATRLLCDRAGARWTVSDQAMKKVIILHGMGWGHMPSFLSPKNCATGASWR